jgi:hypothetical protein
MRTKALLIGVVALALVAAACSSNSTPRTKASPSGGRLSSPARLLFLSPKPDQTIEGGRLVARLSLMAARIVPRATTRITPTTGHVHLSLDGRIVTIYAGLDYAFTDLKAGRHLLLAEFVAANHVPFDPRVTTTVTFTVR